jgi:hypothetical protein
MEPPPGAASMPAAPGGADPGTGQMDGGPLPGYGPGYGYGYGMPGRFPPPGVGYGAYPETGYPAPPGAGGAPPPAGPGRPMPGSTTFDQHMTDEAYILDIALDGIEPAQVQVDTFGRALVVRTQRAVETRREESFEDGRGVARTYSWSSGSTARRLPVPPDADLGALTREDSAERVRITIPRISSDTPAPSGQTDRNGQ